MTTVAFVPATPLLIPEVAVDSSPELEALRSAALSVVAEAVAGAGRVVVVAAGPTAREVVGAASASFGALGVDLRVGEGQEVGWRAGLGLWLLGRIGWDGPLTALELPSGAPMYAPSGLSFPRDAAVVVVADASAGLGPKSPGYVIDGAEAFGDTVEGALAAGSPERLAALDLTEGRRVLAEGAEALAALGAGLVGQEFDGEVRLRSAPHGVDYLVALWRPAITAAGGPRS